MQNPTLNARPGAVAFAAALALCPTSLSAQESPIADMPVTVVPAPGEPAPTADPAPAEPAATEAAPAAANTARPAAKAKTTAAARKFAPAKAAADPAPAATPAPAGQSASAPVPTPQLAEVVPPPPEPTAGPMVDEGSAKAAFGGALALLLVGGAALGLSRRRKSLAEDEADYDRYETADPESAEPAPSALADRPAFAWGAPVSEAASAVAVTAPLGESRVERARRGPTPDNPSLSLRKRLKRAAFYDQREREAAVGNAASVAPLAGLPSRSLDGVRAPAVEPKRRPAYAPAQSFGRMLEPA